MIYKHLGNVCRMGAYEGGSVCTAFLCCSQFYDMSSGRYLYHGIDKFWDEDYNSQVLLNVTPGPWLDMYIFYCMPNDVLKPGVKAAIAVAAFLLVCVVLGLLSYLLLAKASKFRRFLALSAIRIKGPPRSGRIALVVTDIEGYSGDCESFARDCYSSFPSVL